MTALLFFDDNWLLARSGFKRQVGKPILIPESVYNDPKAIAAMGSVSVCPDVKDGGFLLFHAGFPYGATRRDKPVPLCAHSPDGIHWQPLDTTGHQEIPHRIFVNQMMDVNQVNELAVVCFDEKAPPQMRYRALTVLQDIPNLRMIDEIWTSADGRHWEICPGVFWHERGAEPGAGACYIPWKDQWLLSVRPDWGERRIALSETRDWIHFTEPELCLQADSMDEPLCEIYGMPVFCYKNYVLGFPWMYHVNQEERGTKFWHGRMDAQIAYSMNGVHFQRGPRTPLFATGEFGSPDYAIVLPIAPMILADGSMRVYAYIRNQEHGPLRIPGVGAIAAYSLREDGFVYLETTGGPSTLCTRTMYLREGGFTYNLQAEYATCALLDRNLQPIPGFSHEECIPFQGDSTAWQPQWKEAKLCDLQGKVICSELRLLTGRVYAISGDYSLLSAPQASRFETLGILRPSAF